MKHKTYLKLRKTRKNARNTTKLHLNKTRMLCSTRDCVQLW